MQCPDSRMELHSSCHVGRLRLLLLLLPLSLAVPKSLAPTYRTVFLISFSSPSRRSIHISDYSPSDYACCPSPHQISSQREWSRRAPMVNLAPQGPSLKCMVQEFAVPIVVGPSSRESSPSLQDQPQPHRPAAHSVVSSWSSSLKFCYSDCSRLFCPASLFCAAACDSPRTALHHRLLHQRLPRAASVVCSTVPQQVLWAL
jgi:hypothetical protein